MIIRDPLNHLNIDIIELKNLLSQMEDWEDWHEIRDNIFKLKEWRHAEVEIMEMQKKRTIEKRGGCVWKALANPIKVSAQIEYLYEICQEMAFKKFEMDAYQENIENINDFGKHCVACNVYTETSTIYKCPFCGRKLFLFPLNNI